MGHNDRKQNRWKDWKIVTFANPQTHFLDHRITEKFVLIKKAQLYWLALINQNAVLGLI